MSTPRTPIAGYTPVLPIKASPSPSAHPPLPGCEPVMLFDHAPRRHTFQSSALSDVHSAWMYATEEEEEPWWEIDLAQPVFVERITIWLAPVPADVEITITAHVLHLPGGKVPPASPTWQLRAAHLRESRDGSQVVMAGLDTMARYLRVTMKAPRGERVSLTLRGAEILGTRVPGESLLESYERAFTLFADRPLFSARRRAGEGPFEATHGYRGVWESARALAAALRVSLPEAGRGERLFLGMCTKNRPEWVMMDLACLMLGHVAVPLSPDDSEERLAGILKRCPLSAVLVEGDGAEMFARLSAVCPTLRVVVSCQGAEDVRLEHEPHTDPGLGAPQRRGRSPLSHGLRPDSRGSASAGRTPSSQWPPSHEVGARRGVRSSRAPLPPPNGPVGEPEIVSLAALIARGIEAGAATFEPRRRDPKELYTLLLTSGSTGVPKGAMRSYATFQAMVESYYIAQPAVHLSFQPLSHLSERLFQPAVILNGGQIGFSAGGAHVLADLAELSPSVVSSVPRLYEVVLAQHRRRLEAARAASPDEPFGEVEARVLAETRKIFGPRVQAVATGSAPCSPEVLSFLKTCFSDLWVADGYGSTEVGTITSDGRIQAHVKVKLVPLPSVAEAGEGRAEARREGADGGATGADGGATGTDGGAPMVERGEIWVKSPHMIDGYFGDPAATAAALDEDGYFATGDLGERLPDGGVRVVGRVKNVLKLGQGEFVAVDRIEAQLLDCPLVDQIFVHPDASMSSLVAVVVPRAEGKGEGAPEIVAALRQHGRKAGLASFEIPRAVIVEEHPFTVESGLLTASGKLARAALIARYSKAIAEIGAGVSAGERGGDGAGSDREGDTLAGQIARVASRIAGRPVSAGDPLHEGLGVDSLVVADVLSAASAEIGREIPLSMWFEARTLEDLARRLDAGMLGRHAEKDDRESDSLLEARPRVRISSGAGVDFSPGESERIEPVKVPFETIVLTGATGLLGAHLLEALIARTKAHVICLVRAARGTARSDSDVGSHDGAGAKQPRAIAGKAATPGEAAAERVRQTLARYEIPDLDSSRWSVVAADLGAPLLGLTEERCFELAERADAIVHAGAEVNWLAPYEALRPSNVLGTLELLNLAITARTKPFHHVSTISTALATGDETSILSFSQARLGSGYGLAKWVAEKLVTGAASKGHPAAIYRPAMITGHSARGAGNPDDYVHRYLRASASSGRFLDSRERLDMTPVDYVAGAIVALLAAHPEGGATHHLVNIDHSMTYAELGRSMERAGVPMAPTRYSDFRALVVEPKTSPLRPLRSYFPESGFAMSMGPWPSSRTREALSKLGVTCPEVDDRLIAVYLGALRRRGLLDAPAPLGAGAP